MRTRIEGNMGMGHTKNKLVRSWKTKIRIRVRRIIKIPEAKTLSQTLTKEKTPSRKNQAN